MHGKTYNLWRQYAGYFRGHRGLLAGVTAAGVAQSFAYLPLALILRHTFDVVLPARDAAGLWIAVAELAGIQLASLGLSWWTRVSALRVSQDALARMRRNAVRRFYELPRSFHTGMDVEHLHVTLVHETNFIESMTNALTTQMLPASFSALVLFALLFATEPRYAVIIGIAAPALFVVNRLMVRRAWFRQERLRRAFEQFSRAVRFAFSAVDLTKAHAAEEWELARQDGHIEDLRKISLELNRSDSVQQLLQMSLLLAATIGVLIAGGWAVAEGRGSRGQIMAFYVLAALFAAQSRMIVESVPLVRLGLRAFDELAAFLANPDREPYRGTKMVVAVSTVRLQNASFEYRAGHPVLQDVTFEIHRGERAALIGANGSGKSTLLFLLLGLYRPSRGTVSANGIPYDEYDIRSLRSRMAVVPQNPFLLADTVRANLVYGATGVTEEAIREALRWSGAAEFVSHLPHGLDQEIGEQGVRLSGGQRQRLIIARALLRRPDLLILDEPTNHLDEQGIADLMSNLARLPFRPAVILISHEWRVLRHVDRAWRLIEGRLEEGALESRSSEARDPLID